MNSYDEVKIFSLTPAILIAEIKIWYQREKLSHGVIMSLSMGLPMIH